MGDNCTSEALEAEYRDTAVGVAGLSAVGPSAVDPITPDSTKMAAAGFIEGIICENSYGFDKFLLLCVPRKWQLGNLDTISTPSNDGTGVWSTFAGKSAIFAGNRTSNVSFLVFWTPGVVQKGRPGTDRKSNCELCPRAVLAQNPSLRDIFSFGVFPPAANWHNGGTAHWGASTQLGVNNKRVIIRH